MDAIVVPALRELACVVLLGRFQIHTSDTIGLLREHIEKFGEYTQVCRLSRTPFLILIELQKLRTIECFLDDPRLTFSWPKMHSITHLIESIEGKGVTVNTSTDNGEALHPQMRTHWQRTNHQPETAEDQVRCFHLLISSAVLTLVLS